eukprot:TRINITY_DN4650_c0_g1_i1.p1 TRINITY_DN4650_c0_g1~~TRINITY_DN4650_c0_g1_i1.p1  ORF type:complete len:447 (-),score=82.36 TRINITY_DN4650_c0_g1_i1:100-1440(-)
MEWWWVVCVGVLAVVVLVVWFVRRAPNTPLILRRSTPVAPSTSKTGRRYLVTGGNGFVGSHIVEALLQRGETDIVVFDTAESPLFGPEIADGRVTFVKGDVTSADSLYHALSQGVSEGEGESESDRSEGEERKRERRAVDCVFHTAAIVNYWDTRQSLYQRIYDVNVTGTQNVVDQCQKVGVKQLLHTSTVSMFAHRLLWAHPIRNLTEDTAVYNAIPSLPQTATTTTTHPSTTTPSQTPPQHTAEQPLCHYTYTKMLAERIVLQANGRNNLQTVAIRPAAVFGPRDEMLGRMCMEPGPKMGLLHRQDFVYVENVVHAFLLAEAALLSPSSSSRASGQAYFVTNGKAVSMYDFYAQMCSLCPHRQPVFRMPHSLLYVLALVSESLTRVSGGRWNRGHFGKLSRASLLLAGELFCSDAKAREHLQYAPVVSLRDGLQKTVTYWFQYV